MNKTSIIPVANIFCKAIEEVVDLSCKLSIKRSSTIQYIPTIQMNNDIGVFVAIEGNYRGLIAFNFEGDAALEIVTASMKTMGFPEDEIPVHFMADDIRNSLGELINHIVGKGRAFLENEYDLSARASIPAVVPFTAPIGLVFNNAKENYPAIRISFKTPGNRHFYMEMTMEPTLFVRASQKD